MTGTETRLAAAKARLTAAIDEEHAAREERDNLQMDVRAEAGAALLDDKRPGWWKRTDLSTLDMFSRFDCVSGQEYAADWRKSGQAGSPYEYAMDKLALPYSDQRIDLGFTPAIALPRASLTAAWTRLIIARRAADPDREVTIPASALRVLLDTVLVSFRFDRPGPEEAAASAARAALGDTNGTN